MVSHGLQCLFSGFVSKQRIRACFLIMLMVGMLGTVAPIAEAKKKDAPDPAAEAAAAAAKAEAEAKAAQAKEEAAVKKVVTPLDKTLTDLMGKYEARLLFSPQDASKLGDAKFKLADLMNSYPASPLISKPLYQAGFLLAARGEYDDAYEILSFLSAQQPSTPYSQKAKIRLYQLQKQLGADYFQALQAAAASGGGDSKTGAAPAGKDAKPAAPKK